MSGKAAYHLKGILLGACNCDWGCPCNFEAPPSQGACEGGHLWHLEQGSYQEVSLAGLHILWLARSPGPLHLGNLTGLHLVDDRASAEQRQAIEAMLTSDPDVVPFAIFLSLTGKSPGLYYKRFEVELNGVHSRARVGGVYKVQLVPMKNPVTGEDEPATLIKPKGFTSQHQQLCFASTLRLSAGELSFSHSGKYGEYNTFEYKGG